MLSRSLGKATGFMLFLNYQSSPCLKKMARPELNWFSLCLVFHNGNNYISCTRMVSVVVIINLPGSFGLLRVQLLWEGRKGKMEEITYKYDDFCLSWIYVCDKFFCFLWHRILRQMKDCFINTQRTDFCVT